MSCFICGRVHFEACVSCGDKCQVNCHGRCTVCQKKVSKPRRWKKENSMIYGCYFPSTDLNVSELNHIGTGKPKDVTWID